VQQGRCLVDVGFVGSSTDEVEAPERKSLTD
jgi:hypothetical protein